MARTDTHSAVVIRKSTKVNSGTFIPQGVLHHPQLQLGSRLLYGVLYGYIYGTGQPVPNHLNLSRELRVSPRTVRTLLADLKRYDLLRVTRVGARKPNRYELKFVA